jgi:hypothetical protein
MPAGRNVSAGIFILIKIVSFLSALSSIAVSYFI